MLVKLGYVQFSILGSLAYTTMYCILSSIGEKTYEITSIYKERQQTLLSGSSSYHSLRNNISTGITN